MGSWQSPFGPGQEEGPIAHQGPGFIWTGGNVAVGVQSTTPPLRLLQLGDAPTLMVDWIIGSIYAPCAVAIKLAAPPAGAANIIRARLTIRLSGLIVWVGEQEVPSVGSVEESEIRYANFLFTADLVNPIVLKRGGNLTAELSFQGNLEASMSGGVAGAFTAPKNPNNLGSVQPSAGFLGYTTRALTGHHQL